MSLDSQFEQFIGERIYLKNVSPKTRDWYQSAWQAFRSTQQGAGADAEGPISRADLAAFVIRLRERGVKPVSCNTWLRALNAFCRWTHEQGLSPKLEKLQPQRLAKPLLATHDERVLRLILTYRPKNFRAARVHTLTVALLDTGCRVQELLSARVSDFDFDQLLLTVTGKGRKDRRVPVLDRTAQDPLPVQSTQASRSKRIDDRHSQCRYRGDQGRE